MKTLHTKSGFTLIELLVVISIIAILSGVIFTYARQSSATSRDIQRQSDLKALQSAVELFKQKLGRYPAGCNGPDNWSGEQGGGNACGGANVNYITGLSPEFIRVLPRDPRRGTGDGYAYVTNTNGSVYKIVARGSVESETVGYNHPMKSCDARISGVGNTAPSNNDIRIAGYCGQIPVGGNNYKWPQEVDGHPCNNNNPAFNKAYGVWGGYAPLIEVSQGAHYVDVLSKTDPLKVMNRSTGLESTSGGLSNNLRTEAIQETATIICK